jgi:hypothetical protein
VKIAFLKPKRNQWLYRLVSWWTHGEFFHWELLIVQNESGEWLTGSANPTKGVFLEWKTFDDSWTIVDCPIGHPLHAQLVFEKFEGQKYDYLGLLGFVFRRGQHVDHRWFCSEIISMAIGLKNPWRYCPNTLYDILKSMKP